MSKTADTPNNCPGCGTPLKNAGTPIGDDYCPNDDCRHRAEEIQRQISSAMEACRRDTKIRDAAPDLLEALERLLESYTDLANSGDCGFWNPEEEEIIIAARAAISKATGGE